MRRVALIYNPQSGLRRARRHADVELAASIFRESGAEVAVEPTTGPRSAEQQARRFVADGFDSIVAGGGDGTVHDVLQGVAKTPVALGVLPLGTANSLGCDLGLPRDPQAAARLLVNAAPKKIAVGQLEFQSSATNRESRYFTVAAGIGADAALFYKINAGFKRRWGMAAYCVEAVRQWAMHHFRPFRVEWFDSDLSQPRSATVTQLLVVRIADFGGVLKRLAPGANLLRDDFRLVLFKTSSRTRYLRFATGRVMGQDWADKNIELVHATQVRCLPQPHERQTRHQIVHAEADGEWLGRLPVSISSIPGALNLLVPTTASWLRTPQM